jgi:hypothetical protein
MSDRTPEAYFPPSEPTPEQARSNTLFGLALFGIALLLFAGVIGLAFVYLALDSVSQPPSSRARTSPTPACHTRSISSSACW